MGLADGILTAVQSRNARVGLLVLLLCCNYSLLAQSELNDYSRVGQAAIGTTLVSDYQCVGVNPANLGFIPSGVEFRATSPIDGGLERLKRRFSATVGEVGAAVHSDAMGSSDLINSMFNVGSQSFTQEEKIKAAQRFSGKGVYVDAEIIGLGLAYQTDFSGGFAFQQRDRISAQFVLNSFAAQFAFLGRKAAYFDSSYVLDWNKSDTVGVARHPKLYSTLFDSTRIAMSWTREWSVSYGRDVIYNDRNQVYLGMTLKYIQGYALLNSYIDEDKKLVAYSAITPLFNINYGKSVTPSHISETGMVPVGKGFGFDVGTTWIYRRKWRFGLSVLDIGNIKWSGNVYAAEDYIMNGVSSAGFASYNLFSEAQKITGNGNYFKWSGLKEVSTALPTRIRAGMSYEYSGLRYVGFDLIMPLNTKEPANLKTLMLSLGVNHYVLPWLYVQGGVTFGGTMGFNMPVGALVSIYGGVWEFGLSTRDILTYLFDKNPTVGLSAAVCRIRL